MKPQSVYINFEMNESQMTILVERLRYGSKYSVMQGTEILKQGNVKRVNLHYVLFDIVRANGYLPYCDLCLKCSTYDFRDASVEISLNPSKEGSWLVRIKYKNNRPTRTQQFSQNMSQGDVMNSLISELGLPEPNGNI